MSSPGHPDTTPLERSADERPGWLADAFRTAYGLFDSPQMASAAALVGAASRLVFCGSGQGLDVAECAAAVFDESGFDASGVHAGELAAGSFHFDPGDLAIGIDSDSEAVAGALRHARNAGLHTIGITTRDLTIIDADVLFYVPTRDAGRALSASSALAFCLTLTLLAARVESGSAIAAEVGSFERLAHGVARRSGRLMASIFFSPAEYTRVVFAGRGTGKWASRAISHRLNQVAARDSVLSSVDVDLHDVAEGFWSFDPTDILIVIDPYERPLSRKKRATPSESPVALQRTWVFTSRVSKAPTIIQLPSESPALGSLIAFTALLAVLESAVNPPSPSP